MIAERGQLVRSLLLLAVASTAWACAANGDDDDAAFSDSPRPGAGSGGAGNAGGVGTGNAGSTGTAVPEPEREAETQYLAPVVSGRFLWTANPLSGRIAIIDAENFVVQLDTAGDGPTRVLGLAERAGVAGALILNERSDDATLLRILPDGSREKLPPFRTQGDANAWAGSPSSEWAIAYTQVRAEDSISNLLTYQDITLFRLRRGAEKAYALSVGPRPKSFVFDAQEQHAYAVTQAGISVIDLAGVPRVSGLIEISDDPFANPADLDVGFSRDGSRAVVRRSGATNISVLALPSGARRDIELGSTITDLDLSENGELAYAVLGPEHAVVTVPLSAPTESSRWPRTELPEESFGALRLNADESAAVVYSTVLDSTRATVLDVSPRGELSAPRSFELISRVSAMFASPDPRFALSFQQPAPGSTRRGVFSLISLAAERTPKIVGTGTPPLEVAFDPEGTAALLSVGDFQQRAYGAFLIDLAAQRVDGLELASPPLAVGVVPAAHRGYVAQAHPEGRVTFIALDGSDVRTLTGFELAARIRE
ncbi:MAG TPA: hypothetical protein VFQ61_27460 [Polyangiaceae bacterium]|nr:hypothetical protein [Polyangiaceae bacterium]